MNLQTKKIDFKNWTDTLSGDYWIDLIINKDAIIGTTSWLACDEKVNYISVHKTFEPRFRT